MRLADFNGNRNIISQTVRRHREKMKLSQTELAAKMQVLGVAIDQQMISKIESNTRIVKDFELLALSCILKIDLPAFFEDFCEKYDHD